MISLFKSLSYAQYDPDNLIFDVNTDHIIMDLLYERIDEIRRNIAFILRNEISNAFTGISKVVKYSCQTLLFVIKKRSM